MNTPLPVAPPPCPGGPLPKERPARRDFPHADLWKSYLSAREDYLHDNINAAELQGVLQEYLDAQRVRPEFNEHLFAAFLTGVEL